MLRDHAATLEPAAQEDWPAVLDRYGVQFLALDIEADADLLEQFRAEPWWSIDYEGEESVLFMRARMRQDAPSAAQPPYLRGAFVE